MRSGKELILSSREFIKENRSRSWFETWVTLALLSGFLFITFLDILPVVVRLLAAFITSLFYVRMFVIYHDYQHHAILQKSKLASFIMKAFGIFLLTPKNIWKRSHDHHHNHNSKLSANGIGSYPTISKKSYLSLTKKEQRIYLLNRHPLTIIFGHVTLFMYWLNVKSVVQSPKRHMDSLVALLLHFGSAYLIWQHFGFVTFLISWFAPFFIAFAIGSYLFYSQHNFPGAKFRENQDWKYDDAALSSTSFMVMNPVFQWITANIGYHHVHHLNSRIPFYRLGEAMRGIPELQQVTTTTWSPMDIWACFRLKLWDEEQQEMIPLCKVIKCKKTTVVVAL